MNAYDRGPLEPTLEDAVSELLAAVERLRAEPTFENAMDVCLASRVAWSIYYSDWRLFGESQPGLVALLAKGLRQGEEVVKGAVSNLSALDERERVLQFGNSIEFRRHLLDLLAREGPQAVTRAVEQRLKGGYVQPSLISA